MYVLPAGILPHVTWNAQIPPLTRSIAAGLANATPCAAMNLAWEAKAAHRPMPRRSCKVKVSPTGTKICAWRRARSAPQLRYRTWQLLPRKLVAGLLWRCQLHGRTRILRRMTSSSITTTQPIPLGRQRLVGSRMPRARKHSLPTSFDIRPAHVCMYMYVTVNTITFDRHRSLRWASPSRVQLCTYRSRCAYSWRRCHRGAALLSPEEELTDMAWGAMLAPSPNFPRQVKSGVSQRQTFDHQ